MAKPGLSRIASRYAATAPGRSPEPPRADPSLEWAKASSGLSRIASRPAAIARSKAALASPLARRPGRLSVCSDCSRLEPSPGGRPMKALSDDLRLRIHDACQAGEGTAEVAERFAVSD